MSFRKQFSTLIRSHRDCRALALSLWSLVWVLVATCWLLRIVGGIADGGASVLATAASLAFSLCCFGIWWSAPDMERRPRWRYEVVAVLAPPALIGLAFAPWRGESALSAVGFLLAIGFAAINAIRRSERAVPQAVRTLPEVLAVVRDEVDEETEPADEEPVAGDASVNHSLIRRSTDAGETVEGSIRVMLAAGQQVAYAHVAFVPPLAARPEAVCHLLSAFSGRVRVAAAQTYGLRIEARRSEAAGAEAVDVAFEAVASQTRAEAA